MSIFKNQRGESRMNILGEISFSRTLLGESYDADLMDTCHQGIGFVSPFPYLRGTEILLKSKNDRENVVQKATVAWSRPASNSKKLNPRYRIGARFHS